MDSGIPPKSQCRAFVVARHLLLPHEQLTLQAPQRPFKVGERVRYWLPDYKMGVGGCRWLVSPQRTGLHPVPERTIRNYETLLVLEEAIFHIFPWHRNSYLGCSCWFHRNLDGALIQASLNSSFPSLQQLGEGVHFRKSHQGIAFGHCFEPS